MSFKREDIAPFMKSVFKTLEEFGVNEIEFDIALEGGSRVKFTVKKVEKVE